MRKPLFAIPGIALTLLLAQSCRKDVEIDKALIGPDWKNIPDYVLARRENGMKELYRAAFQNDEEDVEGFADLKDYRVRQVLHLMGADGAKILVSMLQSNDKEMYLDADALLTREDETAVPYLTAALPKMNGWAFVSGDRDLVQIGKELDPVHMRTDITRALIEALGHPGDDGISAADSFLSIPPNEAIPILTEAIELGNEPERRNAARALIRVGNQQWMQKGSPCESSASLAKHLSDPSIGVRRIIAGGFSLLRVASGDVPIVSKALEAAAKSPDKELSEKAKEAGLKMKLRWAKPPTQK